MMFNFFQKKLKPLSKEEYLNLGRDTWKKYVPTSGQAEYKQGELLRAAVKLRDEAERNGNINWDNGHEILANYILEEISNESRLSKSDRNKLRRNLALILDYEHPQTDDVVFDQIFKVVLDWCRINHEPIPHKYNDELKR